MAIAQVQKQTGSSADTSSVSATFGAGPTQNNLLVAVYHSKDHYPTTPTGWTKAAEIESWGVLTCFYKTAGAAESSTVTVSDGTGTSYQSLTILEYSGITTTTPLDKTATASSGGNVTTSQATGTTATTAQADELLIAAVGVEYGAGIVFNNAWTNSFTQQSNVTGNLLNEEGSTTAHRIVAATGTFTTTETWLNNARSEGLIATFKASSDGTGATVTAATVATVAAVPAATVRAGAVATPSAVAATAAVPAAAVQAGSTLTPSTVVAVATVPTAVVWGPPTGLTATPVTASQIDLSWNAHPMATAYDIERDGVVIATDVGTTSYQDTGLAGSTTYDYRVRSVR
jgi:hypothetical protein